MGGKFDWTTPPYFRNTLATCHTSTSCAATTARGWKSWWWKGRMPSSDGKIAPWQTPDLTEAHAPTWVE